jgi:trehalose 6-phosphate synthase/phosphatase
MKLTSGGLVSALNALPQNNLVLKWLGVADFSLGEWEKGEKQYEGEFKLHPVFLNEKVNKLFYEGFSNSVLWPLFHYFPSFVEYSDESFDAFVRANELIADKASQLVKNGDVVWIHDYHLLPLAALLRKLCPNITIGFFLHTPFPNYELLRLLPKKCRQLLMDGILGADVIGFQTFDYVHHFLESVKRIKGIQHKQFSLLYQNRSIKVGAFPISIDYKRFNMAYNELPVKSERDKLKQQYSGMKIIFSVDRLDYTKGILNRLRGFKRFLELYPEWCEKIVFVLVLIPSRTSVKKYSERRRMIEEMVSSINGKLGNYSWTPIVFQFSSLDHKALLGLYTGCDVALISPVRDGMNLVAKEFVAARKNGDGVLMLSNLTGAASELSQALLFNPLDESEIAEKIFEAINMTVEDQRKRITAMQKQIQKHDVYRWADNFMRELSSCTKQQHTISFDYDKRLELLYKYSDAKSRLIVLDYDGTLVPFQDTPDKAVPQSEIIELLRKLAGNAKNDIVIASGRDKATLEKWLGDLPVTLIAEHGAYFRRKEWRPLIASDLNWKKEVKEMMLLYADRCPGAFVEEKDFSLAWHYRNVFGVVGEIKAGELMRVLQFYLENTNTSVLAGNKVVEVKPASINKGNAIRQVFDLSGYDYCMAIGDDKTDEDMFLAINEQKSGYTFKVGSDTSIARYRIETIGQVVSFLRQLN